MTATGSGMVVSGSGQQNPGSASLANSFRVAAVVERLALHLQPGRQSDDMEFFSCCLSLSRGIDYAIAHHEIPVKAQDLPMLLKQVCQRRGDQTLKAAVMVLMLSVKNACQLGWFPQKESEELVALANEMGNVFCSPSDASTQLVSPFPVVSQIMERFYPFIKMEHLLASIEVKPGYGTYMVDFHILKRIPHTPQQKIRLFVFQTDNIDTSACIISPQQVSFLLNGKGVEKRTNVSMDSGPQLPTNVTGMLKYGTNLLQAVGQFNGHYIITVAFTEVILSPDPPALKDYVQSGTAETNSDSDIVEGPSRISLNCPISRTRIKLPVKGHLCKHLQCFDFGNYVDINSRRPTWRCPHCNQPVCYTDIRVDQNIVKVLKEVADNVASVIISADGSWKAVMESHENTDPVHENEHDEQEPTKFSNVSLLDLTADDNEMDKVGNSEVGDRKPLISDLQESATTSSMMVSNVHNTAGANQQNTSLGDFLSEFYFRNGSTPLNSTMQNQLSAPSNIPLQTTQLIEQAFMQEYARISHIPRNVTRNPVAIQALPVQLPVQSQTPSQQQRPTTTTSNTTIPNGHLSSQVSASPPVMPVGNVFSRASNDMEMQQQFSRAHANSSLLSSSQQHSAIQNRHSQDMHRMYPLRSPSPVQLRPSSSVPQSQSPQGVALSQHNRFVSCCQQTSQLGGQRGNQNGMVQAVSRASDLVDLNSEVNWRPAGRMRGSLLPGAYSKALDALIIRPTQSAQAGQPSVQLAQSAQSVSRPPSASVPPHLQALLVNRRHPIISQTQSGSPSVPPPGFTSQMMHPQPPAQ